MRSSVGIQRLNWSIEPERCTFSLNLKENPISLRLFFVVKRTGRAQADAEIEQKLEVRAVAYEFVAFQGTVERFFSVSLLPRLYCLK